MRPTLIVTFLATLLATGIGRAAAPGETIRDCDNCPELVVIPAGSFKMGDPSPNTGLPDNPAHPVTIAKPFAIGKYEVTFAEWDACVAEGGCTYKPKDNWGRDKQPVSRIGFGDIPPFMAWLSKKTGKTYRLPTEAEWEYAARAGTTTPYAWGADIGQNNANCAKCGSKWDNNQTAPVGSFKPNAYGLYDMAGNVAEWVADCYVFGYVGATRDGTAVHPRDNCRERAIRGGSWNDQPKDLTVFARQWYYPTNSYTMNGFRVARSLE